MDIYRHYFGKRLKEALDQAGLSQTDLAEKLGVNDSAVSRWTRGADFPGDDRLPDICKSVGVAQDFFLQFTPSPAKTIAEIPAADFQSMLNSHLQKIEEETAKKLASPVPLKIWAAWSRAPKKVRLICEILLTPPPRNEKLLEEIDLSPLSLKTVSTLLRILYDRPTSPPKA